MLGALNKPWANGTPLVDRRVYDAVAPPRTGHPPREEWAIRIDFEVVPVVNDEAVLKALSA